MNYTEKLGDTVQGRYYSYQVTRVVPLTTNSNEALIIGKRLKKDGSLGKGSLTYFTDKRVTSIKETKA